MHESDGSHLPSLPNQSHLSRWKKISSKHSLSTHRCRIILGSATPDKKISPISLSLRQQATVVVDETSEPESPTHDGIVRYISGIRVRALRSISSSMVSWASGRLRSRTRPGCALRICMRYKALLGACPRKKSLKNNALKLRRDDFKISHFPETRVLTGGQNFCTFLKNC
jgi:hypothetical protein